MIPAQLSFIGLRALHILSLTSFPIVLILYIVLVAITGPSLRNAVSDVAKAATHVTASGVLGYGASLIGFTVSYSSLAADFVRFSVSSSYFRLSKLDNIPSCSYTPATPVPLRLLWPVHPYYSGSDLWCCRSTHGFLPSYMVGRFTYRHTESPLHHDRVGKGGEIRDGAFLL